MKKSTSIRLFFIVSVILCCAAYGTGYYFSLGKWEEHIELKPGNESMQPEKDPSATGEDDSESTESAASVTPYQYVLCQEDGYVIVYYADRETVYSNTDIRIVQLPAALQEEIATGKKIYSEQELYNFLESYSS